MARTEPQFSAPVSRLLAVTDLARSAGFYRDVLGFEVRDPTHGGGETAELVSGPVRLLLQVAGQAIDSTLVSRPRGAAIIFFESQDVAALHASVLAKGGRPSSLEKVNWLKYQLFQLSDPDGHTLWFGQSFHVPDEPPADLADRQIPSGAGQLRRMIPEFPLRDISAGVAHYRDVLGFTVNYAQEDFGILNRDSVSIALVPRTELHQGIGSCYVYIRDADALHAELVARGARVMDEPMSMPWGLRQFHVLDLEGNQLTFGQPFE